MRPVREALVYCRWERGAMCAVPGEAMSGELTREQFHQAVKDCIDPCYMHITAAFALEDHDAALRTRVEKLEKQQKEEG